MSSPRVTATIDFFRDRHLGPARVVHRHDGTAELAWYVDDCDDRYVRATSSVRGDDYVLVARDLRVVESAVLGGQDEIFEWVSAHLVRLSKSSLNGRHGAVAVEGRS